MHQTTEETQESHPSWPREARGNKLEEEIHDLRLKEGPGITAANRGEKDVPGQG